MANRNKRKERSKLAFVVGALIGWSAFIAPPPGQANPINVSAPMWAWGPGQPAAPRTVPEGKLAHNPPE